MAVPAAPKIYHIIHVDRLASVVADGSLLCDTIMSTRPGTGTVIGMDKIKARRLSRGLASHPGLSVGQCVPFYFSPRSVMLFLIARANQENLGYRGGQAPILHLEADLHEAVSWAESNGRRWAFTLSNAGAAYFEDRSSLAQLDEINWSAVHATKWAGSGVDPSIKDGKQAEFLLEESFPWSLVSRVGVGSPTVRLQVEQILRDSVWQPVVEVLPSWYY